MGNNPEGLVFAVIMCFVLVILGLYLFPGLHAEILAVDTSEWNNIAAVVHAFIPIGFIAMVVVAVVWKWRGQS